MNIYAQLAEKIIKEQEGIIGPVALEQAKKVQGLNIDWGKKEVQLEGDEKDIIEKLIEQYKDLFGQTSVEACREAVRNIIKDVPKDQLPPLLQ